MSTKRERRALLQALAEPAVVLVCGRGGSGKTTVLAGLFEAPRSRAAVPAGGPGVSPLSPARERRLVLADPAAAPSLAAALAARRVGRDPERTSCPACWDAVLHAPGRRVPLVLVESHGSSREPLDEAVASTMLVVVCVEVPAAYEPAARLRVQERWSEFLDELAEAVARGSSGGVFGRSRRRDVTAAVALVLTKADRAFDEPPLPGTAGDFGQELFPLLCEELEDRFGEVAVFATGRAASAGRVANDPRAGAPAPNTPARAKAPSAPPLARAPGIPPLANAPSASPLAKAPSTPPLAKGGLGGGAGSPWAEPLAELLAWIDAKVHAAQLSRLQRLRPLSAREPEVVTAAERLFALQYEATEEVPAAGRPARLPRELRSRWSGGESRRENEEQRSRREAAAGEWRDPPLVKAGSGSASDPPQPPLVKGGSEEGRGEGETRGPGNDDATSGAAQAEAEQESAEATAGVRRPRRRLRRALIVLGVLLVAAAAWIGHDAFGYHLAARFEASHADEPVRVARRWAEYLDEHPAAGWLCPPLAEGARQRAIEALREGWEPLAADPEVSWARIDAEIESLRRSAPQLEAELAAFTDHLRGLHAQVRWEQLAAELTAGDARPEEMLARIEAFEQVFPQGPFEAELAGWRRRLQEELGTARRRSERAMYEELVLGEQQGAEPAALIARADEFLASFPESERAADVAARRDRYRRRWHEADIEAARRFAARYPMNFEGRIVRYEEYLQTHGPYGEFAEEAQAAIRAAHREWEREDYRAIRDHFLAHPEDTEELARRFRHFLEEHPGGPNAPGAERYLAWFEQASTRRDYRVTLVSGRFPERIGKWLSAGPDLAVELIVGGVRYGPSPVVEDSYDPEWNYEFPEPIAWRLGDPVRIRVHDYDWADTVPVEFAPPEEDPLGMMYLSGRLRGGDFELVFESDFRLPELPEPR